MQINSGQNYLLEAMNAVTVHGLYCRIKCHLHVIRWQRLTNRTAFTGIAKVERRHGDAIIQCQPLYGYHRKQVGIYAVPSFFDSW